MVNDIAGKFEEFITELDEKLDRLDLLAFSKKSLQLSIRTFPFMNEIYPSLELWFQSSKVYNAINNLENSIKKANENKGAVGMTDGGSSLQAHNLDFDLRSE